MLVDGKVLKAPITSKTLNALGYEVSDNDKSDGDIDTEGVYMYAMNCVNKDTGVTIGTSALINNGNKTMDYASSFGSKDLEFYKLMFSGGDNEENDYNFEITKGITIGSTEDDVKTHLANQIMLHITTHICTLKILMLFQISLSLIAENPDMRPLILVMAKFRQLLCLQK
ncbi:MAG: hypothetical protein ACLT3Y_04630 [Ruminococcus callidus]